MEYEMYFTDTPSKTKQNAKLFILNFVIAVSIAAFSDDEFADMLRSISIIIVRIVYKSDSHLYSKTIKLL